MAGDLSQFKQKKLQQMKSVRGRECKRKIKMIQERERREREEEREERVKKRQITVKFLTQY